MRIGYATAMDTLEVATRVGDLAGRPTAAPHASLRGTGLLLDATGGAAARRRAPSRLANHGVNAIAPDAAETPGNGAVEPIAGVAIEARSAWRPGARPWGRGPAG